METEQSNAPKRKRNRATEYENRKEKRRTYCLRGKPAVMVAGNATFRALFENGSVLFNEEGEPFVIIVANPQPGETEFKGFPMLLRDLVDLTDRGYREIKHEKVLEDIYKSKEAQEVISDKERLSMADDMFLGLANTQRRGNQ